jgi:hypothetical protein
MKMLSYRVCRIDAGREAMSYMMLVPRVLNGGPIVERPGRMMRAHNWTR